MSITVKVDEEIAKTQRPKKAYSVKNGLQEGTSSRWKSYYTFDKCLKDAPREGYALGLGNTITNYTPIENYIAMLDENP